MTEYTPLTWTTATKISAKNLNHLETIYSDAISQIDLHVHENAHYTKAGSDAVFFPEANDADADMIDGLHATDLIGTQSVKGTIILFYGTEVDFNNGYLVSDNRWHICDGATYGDIKAPDMRGYFPKCPSAATTTGSGGHATLHLSGTVTVQDHLLLISELPAHTHTVIDHYAGGASRMLTNVGGGISVLDTVTTPTRTMDYNHAAADEAHDHGETSLTTDHVDITPAWKSYYFIIKVL